MPKWDKEQAKSPKLHETSEKRSFNSGWQPRSMGKGVIPSPYHTSYGENLTTEPPTVGNSLPKQGSDQVFLVHKRDVRPLSHQLFPDNRPEQRRSEGDRTRKPMREQDFPQYPPLRDGSLGGQTFAPSPSAADMLKTRVSTTPSIRT